MMLRGSSRLQGLRSGAWLTRRRVIAYAAMLLLAQLALLAVLLGTAQGLNDAWGRPLGTGFSQVWFAGQSVLRGDPAEPFDIARHHPRHAEVFGPAAPAFGWHYPPFYLALAAMVIVSLAALGVEAWRAFLLHAPFTREVVLEQGSTGWPKIQSLFSAIRMWGGGVELAYVARGALTLAVLAAVALAWRRCGEHWLRLAPVPVATVLATPYALDYDLMVVGLSIAFYAAHVRENRLADWDGVIRALAYVAPIATRGVAGATGIPLGLLAMLLLAALLLRRAWQAPLSSAGAPATG
jgi:hypothetical protein